MTWRPSSPSAAGGSRVTPSVIELPEGVRREHIEPLWHRVDRNRIKFAFFILAYLSSIAASGAALVAAAAFLFGLMFVRAPEVLASYYTNVERIVAWAAAGFLVLGSIWVVWALTRSEKRLLGHLGAVLTPTGEYIPTKLALKDMAIAAGLPHAPALWLVPDCTRVNALCIGRTRGTAVMGVTQGFVDRLSEDDQRAVFANLVARLTNGDVRWATAVSALVGPIWALREHDLRRDSEGVLSDPQQEHSSAMLATAGAEASSSTALGVIYYFVLYGLLIVITELLLAGHQRSTMLTAEKADAEGMLLLKDPREMLRALETVLMADNTVPSAGEAHSGLFYCWAGFGFAPEDDPEFERLARLREVLGIEGLGHRDVATVSPERARAALAPTAPRLGAREDGPS
jgi:Zn-dependent protease with chaperone function